MAALSIRIRGQVQGVGFRPFIWQLAGEFGLCGHVLNDPEGVLIEAAGDRIDAFLDALPGRAPPLSRIDAIECSPFSGALSPGFAIAPSRGSGSETRVTPDAATCPACLDEIRTPGRRQGYAFTNCTHCGPRFTILTALPYDRARTTMAVYPLCPECRGEYEDPADRRFHAQPVACPACGPRLWLERADGAAIPGDAIAMAARALRAGQILAIKGLGGFHLACDATDARAIETLRARKRRPTKPFALMVRAADLDRIAIPDAAARTALHEAAAPIVLLPDRGALPESLAPGLDRLGILLPATPLHHLLLDAVARPLVVTSGNLSGEPMAIDNDEARSKLSGFADAFLMHDRAIARRLDDSVIRATPPMVLRRARGLVPGTLPLPPGFADLPQTLALGGQMKAAICLLKSGQALMGHHLGELDEALTWEAFQQADADYAALFDHRPRVIAVDLHPDFRASRHGVARAKAGGLRLERVAHHHAHLAACLAENLWPLDGGPVAGIVLDGLGLGPDGTIWGGELLLGDYRGFERAAWLRPAPLPGGDRAQAEPWRNAVMRMDQAGMADWADRLFPEAPRALLRQAAAKGVNAPLSSSAGRLFDAVAATLGICPGSQGYEGEAAMRLEALARRARVAPRAPGQDLPLAANGPEIDPAPIWPRLRRLLEQGADPAGLALAFHETLARSFATRARALVESGTARAVALTGGCFQNALLLELTCKALAGLPVLTHRQVPANDGGLALGQAAIAAARQESR